MSTCGLTARQNTTKLKAISTIKTLTLKGLGDLTNSPLASDLYSKYFIPFPIKVGNNFSKPSAIGKASSCSVIFSS